MKPDTCSACPRRSEDADGFNVWDYCMKVQRPLESRGTPPAWCPLRGSENVNDQKRILAAHEVNDKIRQAIESSSIGPSARAVLESHAALHQAVYNAGIRLAFIDAIVRESKQDGADHHIDQIAEQIALYRESIQKSTDPDLLDGVDRIASDNNTLRKEVERLKEELKHANTDNVVKSTMIKRLQNDLEKMDARARNAALNREDGMSSAQHLEQLAMMWMAQNGGTVEQAFEQARRIVKAGRSRSSIDWWEMRRNEAAKRLSAATAPLDGTSPVDELLTRARNSICTCARDDRSCQYSAELERSASRMALSALMEQLQAAQRKIKSAKTILSQQDVGMLGMVNDAMKALGDDK